MIYYFISTKLILIRKTSIFDHILKPVVRILGGSSPLRIVKVHPNQPELLPEITTAFYQGKEYLNKNYWYPCAHSKLSKILQTV